VPDQSSIAPSESVIVFCSSWRYGSRMTDQSAKFIAIVDDDESVQSALQDLMEADGLSARCFGSAKEFLESGLQNSAACLILDIRMPGMSGLELQARLKADRLNTPIIFITAHGDARVRMQAMREGAAEFLVKPFDRQVLLNRVRAALDM
jgi:FixJ family two-component response regulator